MFKRLIKRALVGAAFVAAAGQALAADAPTTIRIGEIRADSMIRIYYAQSKGYFAQEGLKPEIVTLGSGPAVSSALASGSVDIGYSGIIPVLFARARNQPFVIVDTLDYEYGAPGKQDTWLIASKASNIHSVADLRGKTIAINATGAVCELLVKEHLAQAGVPYDSVKKIIVPMPQMASMLQVGNADAACISEPFYASAKMSPNVQAVTLGSGVIANLPPNQRIALDVLFAREDWVKSHADVLQRFNRVLDRASADFRANPALYQQWLVSEFKLAPDLAQQVTHYFDWGSLTPDAASLRPLTDAMVHYGLLHAPLDPATLVATGAAK
ncbi:ABC transporter substrate-binding protein [Paraburkholderia pallida]|uniref:ABC transporter substrate-binding protein n=1 Tax=Paraburkholderia pallida TaxID=2547399 RepID=A0A4P7CVU5_9BURK|nr:ABC transporter substrate-binding protein [Paraburkholderia pallida]QBQ98866.1 ABC transporter substrate-binding protein [Paraburkholderia pallida]